MAASCGRATSTSTAAACEADYLFLDFDGVLHDDGVDSRPFEHAARLGELPAGHPEVQVVVTSSWRAHRSLDELRELCGPLLGSRLVGVTRWIVAKGVIDEDPPYSRLHEIADWLAGELARNTWWVDMERAALARDHWIAIDDTDFWFPPGCRQLLHVEEGTGMLDRHFDEWRRG